MRTKNTAACDQALHDYEIGYDPDARMWSEKNPRGQSYAVFQPRRLSAERHELSTVTLQVFSFFNGPSTHSPTLVLAQQVRQEFPEMEAVIEQLFDLLFLLYGRPSARSRLPRHAAAFPGLGRQRLTFYHAGRFKQVSQLSVPARN